MRAPHIFARPLCLAAITIVVSAACAASPTAPSESRSPATAWLLGDGAVAATLTRCLAGQSDASCFSANGLNRASAPLVTAPVFNNNQPLLTSGANVSLFWSPPAVGSPIAYIVEASSVPGGPPNLANFNTGSALTTLLVPNVPAGTYYVRIRAFDQDGLGPASNEVQVVVGVAAPACPSAPRDLNVVSQVAGTVTLSWLPPISGAPTSYVVQAGSAPNTANLANFDTNSTALSLVAPNVPDGSYFVRVYARNGNCAPPAFLGPASNEVLLTVGGPVVSGWSGQIVCRKAISGSGYQHNETQTWVVGGPGQIVGPRTSYPVQWSSQGSGSNPGNSWTINATATTTLSVTIVASTGLPTFDRTTDPIIIRDGILGTSTSFDLYEDNFPPFVAGSPNATSVSGSWSRPTVGGDSPQQPGNASGTLTCNWALTLR
jgi:hypothetical protein